jgi:hypothetical protein
MVSPHSILWFYGLSSISCCFSYRLLLGLITPRTLYSSTQEHFYDYEEGYPPFFFCLELFCAIFFGKYFKLATPSRIRDRSKLQFMALFDHAHYKVSWLEKLFTYR